MKNSLFLLFFVSSLWARSADDLRAEVADYLPEIWGWCSQEKASQFIDLVLEVKPQVCVEIGVFAGASFFPTAATLKYLGEGVAIAVDAWDIVECIRYLNPEEHAKDIRWWARVNMDHIYFAFLNLMRQFELEHTAIVLRMTSQKAASIIGSIDILHIDGGHFEKSALEDVKSYLPKVRPGGYIWLNDALAAALQPALQLLMEQCDSVKAIDNGHCILFRKRL